MEDWEEKAKLAKEEKELKSKFPLFGKKIRVKGKRQWEEGVVVLDTINDVTQEMFVEYYSGDREQIDGLKVQLLDGNYWVDIK